MEKGDPFETCEIPFTRGANTYYHCFSGRNCNSTNDKMKIVDCDLGN